MRMLESLKNIGGQAKAEDENKAEREEGRKEEEKEEILSKKIEHISLAYAEKKFQEINKTDKNYKFSETIKDFTPIKNIILKPIFGLEEFDIKKYKEKIDLFLQDFYNEIDIIHKDAGFDPEKIANLVDSKKNIIKKYLEVENLKESEHDKKNRRTKIFMFNEINNIEADEEGRYKDLEKLGFSRFDHFLEIHAESFYSTGEKNLGPELIKRDLELAAIYILDHKPETAAVIGKSWLLDTPLADRLGFKRIKDDISKQDGFSTWLQFIDRNGQIDQKRLDSLLKTGELPHKSIRAYIPTEEFLKKYLPESRRGKAILKEINGDREDLWNRIQNESQLVKVDWDNLLKDNIGFEDFIRNNKVLDELLGFAAPKNKAKYFRFLRTMYVKKIPWEKFSDNKNENIKKIDEKVNKAMYNDLFRDKEVIIE